MNQKILIYIAGLCISINAIAGGNIKLNYYLSQLPYERINYTTVETTSVLDRESLNKDEKQNIKLTMLQKVCTNQELVNIFELGGNIIVNFKSTTGVQLTKVVLNSKNCTNPNDDNFESTVTNGVDDTVADDLKLNCSLTQYAKSNIYESFNDADEPFLDANNRILVSVLKKKLSIWSSKTKEVLFTLPISKDSTSEESVFENKQYSAYLKRSNNKKTVALEITANLTKENNHYKSYEFICTPIYVKDWIAVVNKAHGGVMCNVTQIYDDHFNEVYMGISDEKVAGEFLISKDEKYIYADLGIHGGIRKLKLTQDDFYDSCCGEKEDRRRFYKDGPISLEIRGDKLSDFYLTINAPTDNKKTSTYEHDYYDSKGNIYKYGNCKN